VQDSNATIRHQRLAKWSNDIAIVAGRIADIVAERPSIYGQRLAMDQMIRALLRAHHQRNKSSMRYFPAGIRLTRRGIYRVPDIPIVQSEKTPTRPTVPVDGSPRWWIRRC
jgi:hypothetical protein